MWTKWTRKVRDGIRDGMVGERGEKALSGKHPFGVRRVSAQVCYRTVAAALSHAATVMFPFSLVRTGRPPKYGLACASAS